MDGELTRDSQSHAVARISVSISIKSHGRGEGQDVSIPRPRDSELTHLDDIRAKGHYRRELLLVPVPMVQLAFQRQVEHLLGAISHGVQRAEIADELRDDFGGCHGATGIGRYFGCFGECGVVTRVASDPQRGEVASLRSRRVGRGSRRGLIELIRCDRTKEGCGRTLG
jgi:hypothetical protein